MGGPNELEKKSCPCWYLFACYHRHDIRNHSCSRRGNRKQHEIRVMVVDVERDRELRR